MSNEIKVVVFEPKKAPYVKLIPNTLEEAQKIVGGYIEVVPSVVTALIFPELQYSENFVAVCNEEGIYLGLPDNRGLKGTFFIVGANFEEEEFFSVPDDVIKLLIK